MTERNKTAKLAGLVYLILVISGILNLMYIPSKLIVWESAPDTLRNIQQSETLFRLGIVSGIITFLAFLVLPLLLYKLLQEVNKTQALLMVVFALVSIPISFVNMLHKFSVLTLISGADYLSKLSTPELKTLQLNALMETRYSAYSLSKPMPAGLAASASTRLRTMVSPLQTP